MNIIEMARQADAYASNEHTRLRNEAIHEEYLAIDWHEIRDKRFATLVRADEREECAKVCEKPGWNAANWCAKAIRERGTT